MSSCRGFSCTLCRKASPAFGILGFWPIGSGAGLLPLCFHMLGSARELAVADHPKDRRIAVWNCPQCGGVMVVVDRFTAAAVSRARPEFVR
jgi:hypothetical protein